MDIKICGITTIEAALVAAEHGATMIGFVFAPSSRTISIAQAKKISAALPNEVEKVGVFVNASIEHIHSIAKTVGLTMIQLHGEESASFVEKLSYPTIKAFPVDQLSTINHDSYHADYYLIDSPPTQFQGGSGIPFDWGILEHEQTDIQPFILAGGLTPDNVHEAIRRTTCSGVDVSTGVETSGQKDLRKMKAFLQQVHRVKGELT